MYPSISDGIVLTGFSMNDSFVGLFQAGANFVLANLNQPFRFGNASFATGNVILNSITSSLNVSTTSPAAMNIINSYGLTDLVAGLDTRQKVEYVNGYLANANGNSAQYLFLLPGSFDPALGPIAEATKQPVALGELLTLGSVPMVNAYAGPVLVFTGCKLYFSLFHLLFLSSSPSDANFFLANDLPYCGADCLATGRHDLPSIPAAVAANFPMVGAPNFTAYIQPNTGHGLNFHYNATAGYRVINEFLGGKGLGSS